jgi:hypothetical protein
MIGGAESGLSESAVAIEPNNANVVHSQIPSSSPCFGRPAQRIQSLDIFLTADNSIGVVMTLMFPERGHEFNNAELSVVIRWPHPGSSRQTLICPPHTIFWQCLISCRQGSDWLISIFGYFLSLTNHSTFVATPLGLLDQGFLLP